MLDDEHAVLDELDIFSKVGRMTAHDEYIPFQVKNGRLVVKGRSSSYSGKLTVTFQRLDHRDNPKANALIIWRGSIDREWIKRHSGRVNGAFSSRRNPQTSAHSGATDSG